MTVSGLTITKEPGQRDQQRDKIVQSAIGCAQHHAATALLAPQHEYLVAKCEQLDFWVSSPANQVTNGGEQREENGIHPSDSARARRHPETSLFQLCTEFSEGTACGATIATLHFAFTAYTRAVRGLPR